MVRPPFTSELNHIWLRRVRVTSVIRFKDNWTGAELFQAWNRYLLTPFRGAIIAVFSAVSPHPENGFVESGASGASLADRIYGTYSFSGSCSRGMRVLVSRIDGPYG